MNLDDFPFDEVLKKATDKEDGKVYFGDLEREIEAHGASDADAPKILQYYIQLGIGILYSREYGDSVMVFDISTKIPDEITLEDHK